MPKNGEPKPPKLPKTIGACADLLYETTKARLDLQKRQAKELEKLKTLERALEEKIIAELPKSDASGVSGKVARVKVVTKSIPTVEDWDEFYGYIKKQKDFTGFALLNRAINRTAINELREAGEEVPGTGTFVDVDVSCTKA